MPYNARMFAGHLGAALVLKGASKRVALSALLFAALLLDFVLWVLVLCGVETVQVPPGYQRGSDMAFVFPYSHGFAASILWSLASFGAAWVCWRRRKDALIPAAVLALAVFSHFILDWLVHRPELPLAGAGSAKLGLGLWRHLPWAWTVEAALLLAGLFFYLRIVPLSHARRAVLITTMGLTMLLTIVGQASTAPPPKPSIMAATSLGAIALLIFMAWWVERTNPVAKGGSA